MAMIIAHGQRHLRTAACMGLNQPKYQFRVAEWHTAVLASTRVDAVIQSMNKIVDTVEGSGSLVSHLQIRRSVKLCACPAQ